MASITMPIDTLLASAERIGNVRFSPDDDGIYRRLPLLFSYKNLILPSTPLAVADFLEKAYSLESVPLDDSGHMIIRFHGPTGTYQSLTSSLAVTTSTSSAIADGNKQGDQEEPDGC